jgi:leucyl/phenylalanyl-tRNA---protein transferase
MPSEKRGSSEPHRGLHELTTRFRFPHPDSADDDGFLAVGGDLKPGTLVHAYSNGIFPWTTHPITWWSPDPRAIIPIGGVHVSHSMRKVLKNAGFVARFDRSFREVMTACAGPRPGRDGVWISREFIAAYTRLFEMGFAHSVEIWRGMHMVGGLYGVAVGGFFAGESMFGSATNASKVALILMEERLRAAGFCLFDVQFLTPHLQSMGALEISRVEYLRRLRDAVVRSVSFAVEKPTTSR